MAIAMDIAPESLLSRTTEGTRRLSTRACELTPKLRSALFLASGCHTFGDLLAFAGGRAHVLEKQIRILLDLGLIEVTGDRAAQAGR